MPYVNRKVTRIYRLNVLNLWEISNFMELLTTHIFHYFLIILYILLIANFQYSIITYNIFYSSSFFIFFWRQKKRSVLWSFELYLLCKLVRDIKQISWVVVSWRGYAKRSLLHQFLKLASHKGFEFS